MATIFTLGDTIFWCLLRKFCERCAFQDFLVFLLGTGCTSTFLRVKSHENSKQMFSILRTKLLDFSVFSFQSRKMRVSVPQYCLYILFDLTFEIFSRFRFWFSADFQNVQNLLYSILSYLIKISPLVYMFRPQRGWEEYKLDCLHVRVCISVYVCVSVWKKVSALSNPYSWNNMTSLPINDWCKKTQRILLSAQMICR